MNGRTLFEAIGYVDDRYLDMVDTPEKENLEMNTDKKRAVTRKSITFLIAAAICVSVLTMTAMAAGWIPNIFASVKANSREEQKILEAAAQATQSCEPETITVPEVDFTQFTLFERYYDGETILLSYDLSKIMPEPVVGYQPDAEHLSQIKYMAEWEHTPYPGQTNDTLEQRVTLGMMTQEECDYLLENRTDYGKEYDLQQYWQIYMDLQMKEELSPEQYEQFWQTLSDTGVCCVAFPMEPWIGDHILINGHDNGEVLGPDCGNMRSDYTTDQGQCILLNPLPEECKDQESVTVEIKLKSGWNYWYMELEGDVYSQYLANPEHIAAFTLENVNN